MQNNLIHDYSVEECLQHIDDVYYIISGRWKLKILIALLSGFERFNDIERVVKGITAKVLSAELKSLQANGFLERIVLSNKAPVDIKYIPTRQAGSIKKLALAVANWGKLYKKQSVNI